MAVNMNWGLIGYGKFAKKIESYGANGITIHPRPDERHIKYSDIDLLKNKLNIELNVEGYPTKKLINLLLKIKPNQVTLVYAISGLIGGVLLSLNNDKLIIIACLIFFFKGTFDWADGLLARIKNKTSSFGHILDAWGSNVGYIFFVSGLSIYCFNITSNSIYILIVIFF